MDSVSNVGVLDKAVAVLRALERVGPQALARAAGGDRPAPGDGPPPGGGAGDARPRCAATATAGSASGSAWSALGAAAAAARSRSPASPARASTALRDDTGESVQLYVREGDRRRCAVSLQSPHGLRWIVPEGALLPLDLGSAGRVLSGELGDARLDRERRGARGRAWPR